jgi:hypothetical protein
MGKRLPTILGKAIDDTMKTLNEEHEEGKITDLLHCIERMTQLMDDLHSNATLRVIKDDGEGDVALWNKEIARFFKGEQRRRVLRQHTFTSSDGIDTLLPPRPTYPSQARTS